MSLDPTAAENEIRAAALRWMQSQYETHGGTVPRRVLEYGFEFQGHRVTVIGPAGIWKPRQLELIPLSITSVPSGPYDDTFTEDGLLVYQYRGSDPGHRDNMGLREAMRTRTPLIYLHGVGSGRYLPVWPVFVVEDNPHGLFCSVAIDPAYALGANPLQMGPPPDDGESILGVRKYVAAHIRRRLHQTRFRESVLAAYASRCSFCRLRHRELLDAAHIISDTLPHGEPIIQNGLCLCKIHHAAFDQSIVGIAPDYSLHIRNDVLSEEDGPMLRHGLQELNNEHLILPARRADRPDPKRLEQRFEEFLKSG